VLAWTKAQPAITAPIASATSLDQLKELVAALTLDLSPSQIEQLNEASEYGSAFTRGLRVELPGGITQLLISGTASVGHHGETLYLMRARKPCGRPIDRPKSRGGAHD